MRVPAHGSRLGLAAVVDRVAASWGHRWGHAALIGVIRDTPGLHNHADFPHHRAAEWAVSVHGTPARPQGAKGLLLGNADAIHTQNRRLHRGERRLAHIAQVPSQLCRVLR